MMLSVDVEGWWDVLRVVDYTSAARDQVVMLPEAQRTAVNERTQEISRAVLDVSYNAENAKLVYRGIVGFELIHPFIMGEITCLRFLFTCGIEIVVRMNNDEYETCAVEVIEVIT